MKPTIIFDLGKVLIDWDPELAFLPDFPDRAAARDWMDRTGFDAWNLRQDAGRSFADGLAEARARLGDEAAPLAGYLDRFALTIARPIPGTWDIAEDLAARGHRLLALTNWARETWPAALARYPPLTSLFDDILVSGIEGLAKPDPAIWRMLLARNGVAPGDCLFIDDNADNVAAARALGIDSIRFTTAAALTAELHARAISCTPPPAAL